MTTQRIVHGDTLGGEILDALGIDKTLVARVVIDCHADRPAEITTTSWVNTDDIDALSEILHRYRVIPAHTVDDPDEGF